MSELAPHTENAFLRTLFANLDQSGIRYAVMRNYLSLPDSMAGSDLDILIDPQDEFQIRHILSKSIDQAKGVAIGCSSTLGFFKVFALACDGGNNLWWGGRIDVNFGYSYKGANVVEDGSLLKFQQIYNGIKVLEHGFAALLGVLKELLNNSHLPERYRADAAQAIESDWPLLRRALAPLGDRGLDLLRKIILIDSSKTEITAKSRELQRALFLEAFRRSPVGFLKARFLHEWAKVRRYIHPSGAIVAVLGVDGVGKSTVIDAITPLLTNATHGALEVKHLRPGLLPPLARLKGKQSIQNGPVLNPHSSTPSGILGSLFRLVYLTMDYVLGYWLLLRPKIAKSPTVILFDRYFYDMALDPHRFRIGINHRVIEWFIRLIPKPDVILCLHAKPETIMVRKKELSLSEIKRQANALRDLAYREPSAILESTEGTVEEVRNRVLSELSNNFRSRC